MDEDERNRIVKAIRAFVDGQRMSRATFAQKTRLGKSTVDKLMIGHFSHKTLSQIEAQLGVRFSTRPLNSSKVAADELGRYSWEDVANYPGSYVLVRPSFQASDTLVAFDVAIEWQDALPGLVIIEKVRPGTPIPPQLGTIYLPRASMHIFVLSNEGGWLKSAILTQLDVERKMRGVMLTMGHVFGNVYMPVSCPVILNKYEQITEGMCGRLKPADAAYAGYFEQLCAIEREDFARSFSLARSGR